jgi:hypothetical protein
MSKLIEEEGRFSNPNDLTSQVQEYMKVKEVLASMELRQKELREKIFAQIETSGEEDSNGNLFISLPTEIAGVRTLEKQRRVTRKIDEVVAEEVIEANNLADELYKTIRVVDEDALMAAHYEGKISEDEIDRMYPAKIVWALMTKKK